MAAGGPRPDLRHRRPGHHRPPRPGDGDGRDVAVWDAGTPDGPQRRQDRRRRGRLRRGDRSLFAVTRYNADGTPDASFGTGGMVTTGFGPGASSGVGIALQSDGRVVVAGTYSTGLRERLRPGPVQRGRHAGRQLRDRRAGDHRPRLDERRRLSHGGRSRRPHHPGRLHPDLVAGAGLRPGPVHPRRRPGHRLRRRRRDRHHRLRLGRQRGQRGRRRRRRPHRGGRHDHRHHAGPDYALAR